MNIGQLSKSVGLPVKTIRYYEEIGLVKSATRLENGYRFYGEDDVDVLRIIKYARGIGLPIEKIKKLMIGCKDGDCAHSKEYLTGEINEYLTILKQREAQILELKMKLQILKKSIKENKNTSSKYCCNILGQLTEIGEGGDKK